MEFSDLKARQRFNLIIRSTIRTSYVLAKVLMASRVGEKTARPFILCYAAK